MAVIQGSIRFRSTFEKLFLLNSFLEKYVLDCSSTDEEVTFSKIDEGFFNLEYRFKDSNFTPFSDLLFAVRHLGDIISLESETIDNGITTSSHVYEDNDFFIIYTKSNTLKGKLRVENNYFEETEACRLIIKDDSKNILIHTEILGLKTTFKTSLPNIQKGINHKKTPVYFSDGFETKEICNICSNRLFCLLAEEACNFKH